MGATWIRIIASQVVTKAPCQVGAVVITSTGTAGASSAVLYDGESTDDPVIFTVRTVFGETHEVIFPVPLVCHRGLYVVMAGTYAECLLQYEPLKV